MRKAQSMAALLGIVAGAVGIAASGCRSDDCEEAAACEPASCAELTTPDLVARFGGQLGCGPQSWDGGANPACVPRMVAGAVDATCGLFVDPNGSPTGTGTKEDPMNSIAAAAAKLTRLAPRVYACAGTFTENVELPSLVELYGGLDCTSWARIGDGTKTMLTALPGEIPLTLDGTTFDPIVVEDMHVVAADAVDPGQSSIAAVAKEPTATLRDVVLEAGEAQAGDDGAPFADAAMAGMKGASGDNACSAAAVLGGLDTTNRCGEVVSIGAAGGVGTQSSGTPGGSGQPEGEMNGGAGEGAAACTAGMVGDTGPQGAAGTGSVGLGVLNEMGYTGLSGMPGLPGGPGQGGGGGGGSKGSVVCTAAALKGGAGGGGGGAGGCGGIGGRGGDPGGSSIGLISVDGKLTFEGVVIKTKNGGRGGAGGPGQSGGAGGEGGDGGASQANPTTTIGCKGGPGGTGGPGGRGGGGSGGHSIGIAFKGEAPPSDGVTFENGLAGSGGPGETSESEGGSGVAMTHQTF